MTRGVLVCTHIQFTELVPTSTRLHRWFGFFKMCHKQTTSGRNPKLKAPLINGDDALASAYILDLIPYSQERHSNCILFLSLRLHAIQSHSLTHSQTDRCRIGRYLSYWPCAFHY